MNGTNPPSSAATARALEDKQSLKRSVQAAFDGKIRCPCYPWPLVLLSYTLGDTESVLYQYIMCQPNLKQPLHLGNHYQLPSTGDLLNGDPPKQGASLRPLYA